MSVAMPAAPAKGQTVSILGKKVSWDALVVAGAGVIAAIFLYRAGQPGAAAPTDVAAGGGSSSDSGLSSTIPVAAPSFAPNAYVPFSSSGGRGAGSILGGGPAAGSPTQVAAGNVGAGGGSYVGGVSSGSSAISSVSGSAPIAGASIAATSAGWGNAPGVQSIILGAASALTRGLGGGTTPLGPRQGGNQALKG